MKRALFSCVMPRRVALVMLFCLMSSEAQEFLQEEQPTEQQQPEKALRSERQAQREQERERRRRDWYIRAVDFRGNKTYNRKELLSLMELKPKWPSYNTRYTNFLINSDIDALTTFYRNGGFEYADVKLDNVERDTLSRRVKVRIAVNEGQRIHVGEVNIAANRYTPRPLTIKRFETKSGAPLIRSNLINDIRALKRTLGQDEFLEASVETEVAIDSIQNLADVKFNVTEGPKVQVGNIELDGNKGIARKVVRQELTFRSGDTLNINMVQQSERRLYATGLFNYVQIRPQFDTVRAITEHPDSVFDVQVYVVPTDFFRLQSGLGYSTDEGARISAQATYLNMFRLGQSLTLDGKMSQISQGASAVYVMPRILYMPFQFDTKLYYNRYHNDELYQGEFKGLRFSIGRNTGYRLLYQTWTQWETVDWVNAPSEEALGPDGVPDYPTQSIGADISYDMRNDLFNPTKGGYTSLGLEVAGVFGGNSNRFIKVITDNRVYFSIKSRYFLSMAMRAGWAMPYGESEVVPVQSKFYGGGSNTIRGFPVNKLAVMPNNDPLLGNFYAFFNFADIRFPIYWWINGAVFLDAGNVWSELTDISSTIRFFDDLRWSAGPGIRVDTPIKLVARLDLGFKLDRRPSESRWELHFDLGQPF